MPNQDEQDVASAANSLAQHALAQAAVNGLMVEAMLSTLIENGAMSEDEAARLFRSVHQTLAEHFKPAGSDGGPLAELALKILRQKASGFGLDLDGR